MSTTKSNRSVFYSQLFSGIGIGILLGIIMGLSVSPVVKTILGAMSGLMAAFLGLQESLFTKQQEEDQAKVANRIYLNGIRAGSFGLAAVLGLLLGLYLRTHEVFSLSVDDQVKNWTEAGFDEPLAKELIIYQKYKLFLKSGLLNVDTALAAKAAENVDPNSGFLFSKEEMQNYCVSLDVQNKWGGSAQNALEGYEGMDEHIISYAKELKTISESGQLEIMNAVKDLICYLGNGSDSDYEDFCNDIKNRIDYGNISGSLDDIASTPNMKEMSMVAFAVLNHAHSDSDKIALIKAILAIICD